VKYAFFHIAANAELVSVQALNRFLSSHRVLEIDRRFIDAGVQSAWAICVSYDHGDADQVARNGKSRLDYKEILSTADFALFSGLRELRKQIAEEEGIPVYSVFNNAQLADIVQNKVDSLQALSQIDGVGQTRLDRYGQRVLDALSRLRRKS